LATIIAAGRAQAAPTLRRAVDLFLDDQVSTDDWIVWGRSATTAAYALWEFEDWDALSTRQVALTRESGALNPLVISLNFHAVMITWRGDFEAAAAVVAEQEAVREVIGVRMASYGGQLLAAYQGRPVDRSPRGPLNDGDALDDGDGYSRQVASLATAIMNNGLGRYEAALAAAQDVAYEDSFLEPLAVSELIEAAVRCGDTEAAEGAMQRLMALTVPGADWSEGIEARARALLDVDDLAERWYLTSISHLARTPLLPELARSRLLYGEWLRREARRVDAREQLRAAHDALSAVGADGFAERARKELLATGEKVRRRSVATHAELTSQEEHIARLARDGRTNAEIGAEMYLSVRTIEWHLRKVFTKLGIASRRNLADVLPRHGSDAEPQPH
jgi:DNA-binding CsgD family transcriptional regulator